MTDFPNPPQWMRGLASKIGVSTVVPDAAAIITGADGTVRVGDGATQIKNLPAMLTRPQADSRYAPVSRTGTPAVGQDEIVINVMDHGAKGDGSTDDTTAIQTAATLACTNSASLLFPAGHMFMVNAGAVNASGTSVSLICLTKGITVIIERNATVKVISSTTQFDSVFGADSTITDMSNLRFTGGGTIDANSAARIAAHVVPTNTKPCRGIGHINKGNNLKVRQLRFTNFDAIWCIALSSSGAGNMSNVEVAHCQFDNLGTPTATDKHDFSCVYLDAIGMHVHDNEFWAGAPGAQTFTTNYGARTAIELHGSGQKCHHNNTYGLQWGGNLWTSYNCWMDTDASGSKNAVGANWHDNNFNHCAVGVQIGAGANASINYGLSGVHIHHNTITIDPALWNVDTGGGLLLSPILCAHSTTTGSLIGIVIDDNVLGITPNNSAMNTFAYGVAPQATTSHISFVLSNTTVPTDVTIKGNTIYGSLQDGIHLSATAWTGLTVTDNQIRNCHLVAGGTGFPISVTTPNTGATNTIVQTMIARNQAVDDQTTTNSPYGYTANTMSGAVVFFDARSSAAFEILDNSAYCANTATIQPAQGGMTTPSSPGPRLRGTYLAATFSQPAGSYQRGSTITILQEPNAGTPTAAVYHQTGNSAGNGTGSTWQRQPTFSGVVSVTSAYTALVGDIVLANPTSATFAVTTPAAASGASFTVKNVGSVNAITITPATGTVDTASLAPGAVGRLVCDGNNWFSV